MSRRLLTLGFHVPPDSFEDGVYFVVSPATPSRPEILGGFTIRKGCIVHLAASLSTRLDYWFSRAVKISD